MVSRIDMKRLLIIGAGGHGRTVAEAVLLGQEYELTAFLDDAPDGVQLLGGIPVWGGTSELASCRGQVDAVVVAIGRNALRETLHAYVAAVGFPLATVVHPRAIVSPSALIGPGCAVMAGAVIGTQACLAEGAIANCGAVVDHDCLVEAFGHLGVGACMSGGSALGRGAWLQAGAVLGYGVKVPAGQVLRAGEGITA
ncbi:acetyltransferase [Variovorax sp. UMC13]|uniref:acetyltransferase n=1 Tax=Variovorax sp. UMC13 TaxID=1862326 RepID=UPI00287B94F8|nr:acetyltransferase [Variovorax sp. UMC13]